MVIAIPILAFPAVVINRFDAITISATSALSPHSTVYLAFRISVHYDTFGIERTM